MGNSILIEGMTSDGLKEIVKIAVIEGITAMQPKKEVYYTRKELCEKLHLCLPTLDRAIRTGKLVARRINGRILFLESDIDLEKIHFKGKGK